MIDLNHVGPQRRRPQCRKVVGGQAYDTATASLLFHDYFDDPSQPPYDMGSALFVNVWGAYFALDYNYELDPWEAGYEKIVPLDKRQAIEWAERHCPGHVEKIFGIMPEPGEGEPYQTKTAPVA